MCQTDTFTVKFDFFSISCTAGYGCSDPIYMHTDSYSYTYTDCQNKHDDDEYAVQGVTGGGTWGNPGDNFVAQEGWGGQKIAFISFYIGWPI